MISQSIISRVVEMGQTGMTQQAIANELGIGKSSVNRILATSGVDCRKRTSTVSKETIDRIAQMTRDGYNNKQISIETGASHHTVTKYQEILGLTGMRTDGRGKYTSPRTPLTKEVVDRVIQLAADGRSQGSISRELGIAQSSVHRILTKAKNGESISRPKSEPKPEPKPEPQPEPATDSYNISVLVTKADGTQLTRDLTIAANNEREAVGKAFQELHVKYSHSCLVVKSIRKTTNVTEEITEKPAETVVETIEEKVEEKPMEKSNGHISVVTSRKDIRVEGSHTGALYDIRIENGKVRMTMLTAGDNGIEIQLDKINELSEEIFEVLAMISAEVK